MVSFFIGIVGMSSNGRYSMLVTCPSSGNGNMALRKLIIKSLWSAKTFLNVKSALGSRYFPILVLFSAKLMILFVPRKFLAYFRNNDFNDLRYQSRTIGIKTIQGGANPPACPSLNCLYGCHLGHYQIVIG